MTAGTPQDALEGTPDQRETSLERAAGWSFLLLAAALPWSIAPMGIAAGLCAAFTLAVWLRRPSRRPSTPVLWPTLAWAAALALSAAFALDREASLPRLTKALFPLLVPLAATHAARPGRGRRALAVLLVSATLAAAHGLVLYALHGAAWPNRARGAAGHYMTYGGQLLLWVTLAVAVLALERARRWRALGLAAALAGSVALAATFTRSAWLGLAVALATLLGLARPRWLPALAALLVLGLVLAPASIRERAWSAFDPAHPTNLQRTCMWRSGIAMFRDHPLTGVGTGGIKEIYDRYMLPGATERAGHLHSVPVQILATMGLAGLAAFAWLYGSLFACAGLVRRPRAGLAAAVRLGVTALLVGFLVNGLFEWNFGDEELLYPLFTLAGIAWAARGWGVASAAAPAAGEAPPAPGPAR
jgi:O-antigen ligase